MNNLNQKNQSLLEERPISVQDIVEEIVSASKGLDDNDFEVLVKLAKLDEIILGKGRSQEIN